MSTQPPLKGPLETHLEPVLDDARIHKISRVVRAARHLPTQRSIWRPAIVAVAIWVFAAIGWILRPVEPQVLGLADGTVLPTTFPAVQRARELKLSDGSVMQLEADAAAEVVANQPGKMTMLLRQGRARFEVNPKAHRQWLVEAGLATVEVVGTVFTVDRGPDGVRVSVERGIVVVRSNQLPDHLQRLEVGKSVFVPAVAPPAVVKPSEPEVVAPVEPLPPVRVVTPVAPLPPPVWKKAAASGDFATAWTALERSGFSAAVTAATHPDELLALADTARSTHHDAAAAEALKKLLVLAPDDATAAFTLGRLELEKLHQPADAAAHFEKAAALAPLAEDALARRVEALWAAGRKEESLAAARQALERFPKGAHAAQLQKWLDDPAHDAPWPR